MGKDHHHGGGYINRKSVLITNSCFSIIKYKVASCLQGASFFKPTSSKEK
jgi:hypothetical protein